MQYTRLGNTGLKISRICLGCMSYGSPGTWVHPWVLDEEKSRPYAKANDSDQTIVDRVNAIAAKRGVAPATIALAWQFTKSYVSAPIVGATKPGHLEDAVASLDVQLAAEEIAQLEEPYVPHSVAGFQ